MVTLRSINRDNVDAILALDVTDAQKGFLQTTNVSSLAHAYALQTDGEVVVPLAIYADDVVIGFVMYTYDRLDHESFTDLPFYNRPCYFVWHFMIDAQYQRKHYGKRAFEQVLRHMHSRTLEEAEYVALFYATHNAAAQYVYRAAGFVETSIIQDQSVLAIKTLDR